MAECDYCENAFDGEDAYLDHLADGVEAAAPKTRFGRFDVYLRERLSNPSIC